MLKLHQDMPKLELKLVQLCDAANQHHLYPSTENIQEKLDVRLNPYDIRETMLQEVMYLRHLCENRHAPELMATLFTEAEWDEDIFEWLEIDPRTGVGIEPNPGDEILVHNLRVTNGRHIFNCLSANQRTRKIVDTYVFQSPGYRGPNGKTADLEAIPDNMLTDDIIVYTAQICKPEALTVLPESAFTSTVIKRLMTEADADVIRVIPESALTDAALFLFYRNHTNINELRRNDVISTGRKTDLLDIAMAQQVIDHQLLYTICRTIVNLDELPGHTKCDLVHANPYLLHLFLNNSTALQPEPDGHYNAFSIMMAASALSCENMIPSPYSHDHVHHKGCDIARQILPLELIKLALAGKQDTPTRFGSVGFSPDDVVAVSANQGKALTVEEATIWWEKYESEFKKRMCELGLNLLSEMISQDTEVKPC